ncbi:MAG TPA: hypothetical protein VM889_14295 [Candidatus Thermoplasmatota archaeon]|nr:hypothetical protein [Candidatus Thermoplasmatota archaeon]
MTGPNSQTAYALSLAAGIIALAMAFFTGGIVSFFAAPAFMEWDMGHGMSFFPMGTGMGPFFAVVGLVWFLGSIVIGVVLLAAAPKLKDPSPDTRRTWATYAIVAGAFGLMASFGGLVVAGLGIAAGVLTLMDLNQPRAA